MIFLLLNCQSKQIFQTLIQTHLCFVYDCMTNIFMCLSELNSLYQTGRIKLQVFMTLINTTPFFYFIIIIRMWIIYDQKL